MVIFVSNIDRVLIEVAAAWSRCVGPVDRRRQPASDLDGVGGWVASRR